MYSSEIESESESFVQKGWSHSISSVSPMMVEIASVAKVSKLRPECTSRPIPAKYIYNAESETWSEYSKLGQKSSIPDTLPAFQAVCWTDSDSQIDFRPHLFDQARQEYMLVDSGSMVSAIPPEPGDVESKTLCLRAVNGSKIKCYGKKKIEVKLGRKAYELEAYIADVQSAVIGWDFMRKYRLEIVWNDFGDNVLIDKKADISQMLEFKSLPQSQSFRHKKLALLTHLDRKPRGNQELPSTNQLELSH